MKWRGSLACLLGVLLIIGWCLVLLDEAAVELRASELARAVPAVFLLLLGVGQPLVEGMVEGSRAQVALTLLGATLVYLVPGSILLLLEFARRQK